ncbi:diaminobutyrate--2-oxoglutarate transaminase [Cupriavidus necator]
MTPPSLATHAHGQPAPFSAGAFVRQAPIRLDDNPYLQRQSARESNARSYPRRIPLALEQGYGVYLRDTSGQLFIDCLAGAGTLALGHNHPAVVRALRDTLDSGLPLHTLDLATPVKDRFVDDLFGLLPPEFAARARIQFCGPTGADGIEAALKLAKTATGRHTVLSFAGGYHGMTHGTLALMGNLGPKAPLGALGGSVQFLPYPYDYRCPFGLRGDAGIDAGLRYIEQMLADPESGVLPPAAVVVEAVQGEGGVIPAPARWLRELRRITREHGIALVLDEVQTGLGRTGRMFAFEHAGIVPDVLVLSKAIGGGLPMSVVIYDSALDAWQPGAHAGTFRGNQLAMAAGSATIRTLVAQGIVAHAETMGQRLATRLRQLHTASPAIGEVRGRGLMIGVELIDERAEPDAVGAYPADGTFARTVQRECLQRGLIVELGGRHGATVRFLPPLVIGETEIDLVAELFGEAVGAAYTQCR